MKKISVVVPVYNMECYLPRCMETLLSQKSSDFEIILVDDGSKDSSAKMCDEYAKRNSDLIKVIHKSNGGLSSARNAGLDASKGQFVIFPDPDDWIEPEYISLLIELQKKYNSDLTVVGHFIDFDNRCVPANTCGEAALMTAKQAQMSLLSSSGICGFAWNKLYRLDIIEKYNLRFLDDVGTTEDMDFAFRYLDYCEKVYFDPTARVYHYYQREDSATLGGFSIKKFYSIHTYEKIILSSGETSDIGIAAKEEICNVAVYLIWLYKKDRYNDKTVYKRLKKYIKNNAISFLSSKRYKKGRKLQMVCSYIFPNLYVKIKTCIVKKHK